MSPLLAGGQLFGYIEACQSKYGRMMPTDSVGLQCYVSGNKYPLARQLSISSQDAEGCPMHTSRRSFIARSIASACAVTTARQMCLAADEQETDKQNETRIGCLDYGLSFVCNPSPKNAVRFWIESRTTVIDGLTSTSTEFYQCASCKSEHTFAEKDLFQEDNYDFLPVFGGEDAGDLLIFRRSARLSERYREITKSEKVWGKPILKLREGRHVKVLDTWEEIRDMTAAGVPIVSQTEIRDPDTNLRAIIECPIKTMNISLERQMYQVDTGPIALPDLSRRSDPLIDILSLAFVAFNAPYSADFVIEQPTPVIEDGKELCQIHHYSNPISLPARNTLLAVGIGD
ncbi:MAG: hypothetical protein ACYTG0_01430 [Planctomycetota bacterium]